MSFKFLCDATSHRLAKWLRFLGVDTDTTLEFRALSLIEISRENNRMLLTRNRCFLERWVEQTFFLKSDFVFEQLKEVILYFNIKSPSFLTRCFKCNTELVDIEREKVRGRVPYFTYKNFNEFKFCPVCNKIYWKGSHVDLMIERLKKEEIWELLF